MALTAVCMSLIFGSCEKRQVEDSNIIEEGKTMRFSFICTSAIEGDDKLEIKYNINGDVVKEKLVNNPLSRSRNFLKGESVVC